MAKNIDLIIKFDDIEYSEEERNLLWGRFALFLAEAAKEQKENKNAKRVNFPQKHAAKKNENKIGALAI